MSSLSQRDETEYQLKDEGLSHSKNTNPWALRAVSNVYRDEGFAALSRGFVPCILRLGLGVFL